MLHQGAPWCTADSTFTATVSVTSTRSAPISTMEVQLRLRMPGKPIGHGQTLYLHTGPSRRDVTGTVTFTFARSLRALARDDGFTGRFPEGRYKIQVHVTAGSAAPIELDLEEPLLIVDPARKPVPLVVVAQLAGSPMTGPSGSFVDDPAHVTGSRDAAAELVAALARSRKARLSLAVPPFMLEDWSRISDGYSTVGPEGIRKVPGASVTSASYASALRAVSGAVRSSRTELLQVPYAEPDLASLARIGLAGDLADHLAKGLSTYHVAVDATPSAGVSTLGDAFPAATLPVLVARNVRYVVVGPSSVGSRDATPSGAYRIKGSSITALVTDPAASSALSTAVVDTSALYDALFAMRSTTSTPSPVVAVVSIGPGSSADPGAMTAAVDAAARSGWVDVMTAQQAASRSTSRTANLGGPGSRSGAAPAGYWKAVAGAHELASAFIFAAGSDDSDARSVLGQSLVAESLTWAGPSGDWSLADRGLAFATTASRTAQSVLGKVTLQLVPFTLSGDSGRVPITVTNGTDKILRVRVTASSPVLTFPKGASQKLSLRPADNLITVPVDLGQAIEGRLTVTVYASRHKLARSSLTVRASFLDRLVIVAAIVAGLIGLLVFVRRRIRRAQRAASGSGEDTPSASARRSADGEEEGPR